MDPPESSKGYFVSKILAPILQMPFAEYREKEVFENFMQTLPILSTPPAVITSANDFVKFSQPCLLREAYQSVRVQAELFDAVRTVSHDFDVLPDGDWDRPRSPKFLQLSFPEIRKYQLNVTATNFPPDGGRRSLDDDTQWSTKLVVIMSGSMRSPKMQLGFVERGFRPSRWDQNVYGLGGNVRFCLDLWIHASMGLGDGGGQRIAELTSFMSVYRQCWALSLVRENSAVSAPLTQAFLSLPADSFRRGRHDFEDRHDHLLKNLNDTQQRVVKDFVYTVTSTSQDDRNVVLGLQGPPGTGKSETIVTLVKLLLEVNPGMKILIAAPSNAAVDSVGRRIAALRESFWVKKMVRNLKLPSRKVDRALDESSEDSSDEEPDEVEVEVLEFSDAVYKLLRLGRGQTISPDMKQFSLDKKMPGFLKWQNDKQDLLVVGNIFLSTLNSCASYKTTRIHQLIDFDVVIIDEAGQALQLDTLIPVTILGMKKMILVGDQNQLPATVLDAGNMRVDFARSWLERISMHFDNNITEMLPMLDVQYRMHPHICAFPSTEFYRGCLKNGPLVIEKSKDWKLQPLKFFSLTESKESLNGTSKYNDKEAAFIGDLLEQCLKQENSQEKYAVITGYTAQQERLLYFLKGIGLENVRVSTVDSFQGQEKEVIIVSCVRAGGKNIGFLNDRKRVNVALTRAQHSLFIVGHRDTLEAHPIWTNFFRQPELAKNVVTIGKKYSMGQIMRDHVLKPSEADLTLDMQKLSIAA